MTITRVLVDKKILNGFKQRALKNHPKEHLEELYGYVRSSVATICHIQPIDLESSKRGECDYMFDQCVGSKHGKLRLLGSIHTHPSNNDLCFPSEDDLSSALEDGERVMGIYLIAVKGKRRFFSVAFFLPTGQQVETVISE